MFVDIPPKLLAPLHSLLKAPFEFRAGESVSGRLRKHLEERTDFPVLLQVAELYDRQLSVVLPTLATLRLRLGSELSLRIPYDMDLSRICRVSFSGDEPKLFTVDGGNYLRHVTVQCQLERLYDILGLQRSGEGDATAVDEVADVVLLLILGEALALCLAGFAEIERGAGVYRIRPRGARTRDALRAVWFARVADQNTHMATLVKAKQLSDQGAKTASDVQELTERILDQDLSMSWPLMTEEGRAINCVRHAHQAAALIALMLVLDLREEPLVMSGPEMARRGLDFASVSSLIRQQSNALLTDRFIVRSGNQLVLRQEASSKGLRQYLKSLTSEFGEEDLYKTHAGGKFFEEIRIRLRIEMGRDYTARYRVVDGFDRYQVIGRPESEVDIDFIICDSATGHHYFVQAKHALLGERAFFESMVQAVQNDIGFGVNQVREAKRLFEEGLLDATLRERGLEGIHAGNSSFVVVHNIATFDYQYTQDGIGLYDWTSFRNLLKDAETVVGGTRMEPVTVRLVSSLVIDHPLRVIDRLLNEHPGYRPMATDPWPSERAANVFHLFGEKISLEGLGI